MQGRERPGIRPGFGTGIRPGFWPGLGTSIGPGFKPDIDTAPENHHFLPLPSTDPRWTHWKWHRQGRGRGRWQQRIDCMGKHRRSIRRMAGRTKSLVTH